MMEMNKTILDLKREVDTIKKTQSEAMREIETLGKKSGTIDVSINNRIHEMEERILGAEDSIENISTTIKKYNMQKDPNSKHPGNPGHNEKTKPTEQMRMKIFNSKGQQISSTEL
jgi:predicted  nucleic acid-binding Zn-ribbon protein